MKLTLIRHGQTQGNREGRYVGKIDQSLCCEGIEGIKNKFSIYPRAEHIFVSPMKRTRETKNLIYGELEETIVDNLRESSFGDFEGMSYEELKDNPDYQNWIDYNTTIPNGEPYEDFKNRVTRAFSGTVERAFEMGLETVALVIHGGTIMAIMERFSGDTEKTYYDFMVRNGEGYELTIDRNSWQNGQKIISYRAIGEKI